jgi:SAM-dependent methyltransferase
MQYICADALCLPFSDGSFSGIIAGGELINHVSGERLLKEISRVLKPGGKLILSVAMKWCMDSVYSVLDSFFGNKIGYSMTRPEALDFLRHPKASTDVTWEVTPNLDLRITLYSYSHIRRMLRAVPLRLLHVQSLNLLSALVPLPLQQNSKSNKFVVAVTRFLLGLDQGYLGRIPGLRWFAGNVYLVTERL